MGCWSSGSRTCDKFSLLMLRTTMKFARTCRWARMRPWVGRCSAPVLLSPFPSCQGYITITSGCDFRKGQDYIVIEDGQIIGRIYEMLFVPADVRWFWS